MSDMQRLNERDAAASEEKHLLNRAAGVGGGHSVAFAELVRIAAPVFIQTDLGSRTRVPCSHGKVFEMGDIVFVPRY